jgi:hypothetical protein
MGRARDRASADLNGQEFILDADADTSISADTDDQIDIRIAGGDDFQFTANTFTAASGSTIAAQALTATTVTASDDLTVGSTDFFVDTSADKVGIGTATANQLHQKVTIYSSAEAGIQFQNDATGVANSTDGARISVYEDDIQYTIYESSGKHIFNGGSSTASRLEIEADGDVNVKTGNLVIGTSGKGIDFSASSTDGTSVASEVLSDYEQGTWQPSLTNGYSYDGLQAHYTKIGNVVYIYASFYRDGFSTNSNSFIITNLPFTPDTSNKTNSNGLGHWSCYNGTTDRRHGLIDVSNDGNVYFVADGTKVHATYDGVAASDGRGVTVKWFYYTAS